MISLIICSRNKTLKSDFLQNVASTIGCDYELVVIDNSKNDYSIFSAYNYGAFLANYDLLCFIHDDIEFYSKNWGCEIIRLIKSDESIGLIGACGATFKTELPTSWVDVPVQFYSSGLVNEKQHVLINCKGKAKEVVVIDGLFMATKKSDYLLNPLPDWSGYHGYDLFYSLKIGLQKKVVVIQDIAILHKSSGQFNGAWFNQTIKVHEIFKKSLPRFLVKSSTIKSPVYKQNVYKFIRHVKFSSFSFWSKLFLLFRYVGINNNIELKDRVKAFYYFIRL